MNTDIRHHVLHRSMLLKKKFLSLTVNRYSYKKFIKQQEISTKSDLLFSIIIPIYKPNLSWLYQTIESITTQQYPHWEVILVLDGKQDPPVHIYLDKNKSDKISILLQEHRGISEACNTGIQASSGQYIAVLDQDDLLTPDALQVVSQAIAQHNPDIIYSDEDTFKDTIFGRKYILPHFKPDFSPDLLLSHNYITHLMVIKRELMKLLGGFKAEYDGAQDYDLILRASEKTTNICHIRQVLYHWRHHKKSASHAKDTRPTCHDAGKRVLEDTLTRRNISGKVVPTALKNHFRIRRTIRGNPKVSIIIPFRDQPKLLNTCLESITSQTTWQNYEIIGISNNSSEPETFHLEQKWSEQSPAIHFYQDNRPFNYSSINNSAVSHATGDYLILLNNDIEITTSNWIETLLEHAQRPEVGCAGGLLFYPDGTIQHAGIAIGIGGFAGRPHRREEGTSTGYFHRNILTRNVSAVTGALMMVRKKTYLEIGGLDEENLPISLNDVDFCLRLMEKGYIHVYTPYCQAIHAESVSRGFEDSPEKKARFEKEISYFKERHAQILKHGDPYYNPNLTRNNENITFSINQGDYPIFGCLLMHQKHINR